MFHINIFIRDRVTVRRDALTGSNQRGFSLMELLVAMTVMLIVLGAVFSLAKTSLSVAMTTYEMTDAQQSLRTAHEFINRDLMNAGDGLTGMNDIRVPDAFIRNYVKRLPVPPTDQLGIFTSDNDVPAGTVIIGADPAANILTGTDRQTMLEIDPDFNGGLPISLPATPRTISADGGTVTIPAGPNMNIFKAGEVYFFTSGVRGTFGTITTMDAATRTLNFAATDAFGFNKIAAGGYIRFVSQDGAAASSLQRMRMIQYYVTDSKLLMRRVFGVESAGVRASVIAEHVLNVQFNYSLINTNATTGVVTATQSMVLATSEQQTAVRQVEVTVTVETPHAIQNGKRQELGMTTSTSVRNMQFRNAL